MGNPTDRRKTERNPAGLSDEVCSPALWKIYARCSKAIGLPLVLWTIDSGDWEAPNAENIYTALINKVQDGDIIVFHDDNAQTVKALEK